ncbi:swarming motility protein [Reticulibacter mediterranei]|uniref:Swarming motility protein n=1 Tax=Reticulibacter mediterranei TaxID=2778369 RepID=A0A8J3N9H3_9CHLR|nr:NADAR family protein [Reticulibacter mediterranei]GHP00586.1 swarming motility protein [Reticulibacter mediterranei]
MTIYFYHLDEDFACFSNLFPSEILIDGKPWPTAEHYFQAQKFAGTEREEEVRLESDVKGAIRLGRDRELPLHPDWDQVKDEVMRRAVLRKFETHTQLREILLATGEEEIVEKTRDDYYWGCGQDGSGKNRLGQILVEVRTILRERE